MSQGALLELPSLALSDKSVKILREALRVVALTEALSVAEGSLRDVITGGMGEPSPLAQTPSEEDGSQPAGPASSGSPAESECSIPASADGRPEAGPPSFSVSTMAPSSADELSFPARVLAVVQAYGRPMPVGKIAAATGESGSTERLYAALGNHVRRGKLRRVDRGIYAAVEPAKKPVKAQATKAPRRAEPSVKRAGPPAKGAAPGALSKAALEFLRRRRGQAITAVAIAKAMGAQESSVRSALLRAEARGEVTRENRRFRMAGPVAAAGADHPTAPPARTTQRALDEAGDDDGAIAVTEPDALLGAVERDIEEMGRKLRPLHRGGPDDNETLAPPSRPPRAYVIRREGREATAS